MRLRDDLPQEFRVLDHQRIELSDSTTLCARIWLPVSADEQPVPAVLEYLPYRKNDGTAWQDSTRHTYFAGHGYASVRVDIRGTGDSDGIIPDEYSEIELADGLEVLAWIAGQPWCTGKIGMIGYSWGGINGLQFAAARPPELAAIITMHSTDDRYRDECHYKGGLVLGSDMLPWASMMYAYDALPPSPEVVGDRWRDMWLERLRDTPPFSEAWLSHQTRDEYWLRGSVCTDYSAIEVPVLTVGGLADPYRNTVGRLLEHLPGEKRGILGPWGHKFPERGIPGPAIGFLQECVRWWDRWLAEKDSGVESDPLLRVWMREWTPPARVLAQAAGRWLEVDAWPHGGDVVRVEFAVDEPLDVPVDYACGQRAGTWCPNGLDGELPDDQREDDARSLLFDTEPLAEARELLGKARVLVSVTSDRPKTTLVARLCDVAPDGSSALVTWQQQRIVLDGSTDALIELDLTAYSFAPGHRIRVAVSGAYWPHAWPDADPGATQVTALTLELPVATGPDVREMAAPFDDPEQTRPILTDGAVDFSHAAVVQGELVRVEARRRSHERFDSGEGHALQAVNRYTVQQSDPLSARVVCERSAEVFSAGWGVRVVTCSSMTADAHNFYLDNELEAFEDGESVFRDKRSLTIPRADV